jgi:thiol-disulfide isomerase/thioredoxin
MKKIAFLFISVVIVGIITYLSYHIYNKIQQKKVVEKNTVIVPIFSFYTLHNINFNNNNIPNNNDKLIFNFFSPTCEHCQYMATQYLYHKEQLKGITILMITIADSAATAKFYIDYRLNKMPNAIVLRDTKFQFFKTFGTETVPSFFIYNHFKLVKKIIGETKIENLIN